MNIIKNASIEGDILLEGEDGIIGGWIPDDGDYEGSHSGGLDDVAVFSDAHLNQIL